MRMRRCMMMGGVIGATVVYSGGLTLTAWGQLQEDAPWPMFHRDVRHTGRSQYAGPSDPVLGWSYVTSGTWVSNPILSSAVGSDGRIYVGANLNILVFNPDGTQVWSYATGTNRTAPPALGNDGRVYVGGYDGYFRAINSNGALAWQTYLGVGDIRSGAALGNDMTIYVGAGSSNYRFFALNSDGTIQWSYRTGDWVYSSPALGSDGRVCFGSDDNRLYTLNSNGTLAWSFLTGYYVASPPAIGSEERIYVGSEDKRLYALNSDGTLCWSFATGGRVLLSSPALGSDERLYVGSYDDNRLYAFNSNGSFCWTFVTGYFVLSSPALGSGERVYFGSGDNNFYALNSDGTFCWSFMAGNYVFSSPSMGSGGEIYFGSDDLVFYCIKQAPTVTPTEIPTQTPTGTPTVTPTPTPTASVAPTATPTAIPPLIVLPGRLIAGQNFSVYLALTQDIIQPFDFYFFVNTPAGAYTCYLNGKITKGIVPLYRNVQRFTKDYITTVRPQVKIPAGMRGKTVTFYAAFIQAGTHPPVRRLSDLTPSTLHVILMDKASAMVEPQNSESRITKSGTGWSFFNHG